MFILPLLCKATCPLRPIFVAQSMYVLLMVPTRTGEIGRHFPVREKSILSRLEKSGKSQGILLKILENQKKLY